MELTKEKKKEHNPGNIKNNLWIMENYQNNSSLVGMVSVKERVPSNRQNIILIWDLAGQISSGDYFNGHFRDASNNYSEVKTVPTHWMPWPNNWPISETF